MSTGDVVAVKTEAEGATEVKQERPESPDSTCAICLEPLNNKCFTDRCLHQFCFKCLLEWSKIKQECPLCKKRFMTIIHNVRSEDDYDQFPVSGMNPIEPTVLINFAFQRPPFRYRTTMSGHALVYIDHLRWGRGAEAANATRLPVHDWRRRRQLGTSEFRRNIYRHSLWVRRSTDPRVRQSSPEYYRLNPAQTHRLVPWLNRELNVLLDVSLDSRTICQEILNLITLYPIISGHFHRAISRYLGVRTSQFIHEFYNFATSPYDMLAYDLHAQYSAGNAADPQEETEVVVPPASADDASGVTPVDPSVTGHHQTVLPLSYTASYPNSDIEIVGWRTHAMFDEESSAGPSGSSRLLIEISDDDQNSDSVEFIEQFPAPPRRSPEVITIESSAEEQGGGVGGETEEGEVEVGEEEEVLGPRGRKRRRAAANALVKYDFTSSEDESEIEERRRKHRRRACKRQTSYRKPTHRIKRKAFSSSEEEEEEEERERERERKVSTPPSSEGEGDGEGVGEVEGVREDERQREDEREREGEEEEEEEEDEEEEEEETRHVEWSRGVTQRLRSVVKVVGEPAWNLRKPRFTPSAVRHDDTDSDQSYE